MNRDYVSWWTDRLERTMELLVIGHAGTPILAFPSSGGRFYEWEDFGMVDALAPQLENGRNHLICVDSIDRESFYDRSVHPRVRILRHQLYEQYILQEVLPFVRNRTGHDFIIATGASFGAYHAANFVCKEPWAFGKLIALSGAFDIKSFLDGYYDDDVYFSNPVDYLPGLDDPNTLGALRDTHVILTTGEHDPCRDAVEHMNDLLHRKGVDPYLERINGAFGHDWPWWQSQIQRHVG